MLLLMRHGGLFSHAMIEKGVTEVERYSNNPVDINDLVIRPSLTNKLNKLKSNLPEAFYYWAKTSELLEV